MARPCWPFVTQDAVVAQVPTPLLVSCATQVSTSTMQPVLPVLFLAIACNVPPTLLQPVSAVSQEVTL